MKKKGKSLFTYLFILIGIALGVFAVCIAVLVLSPNKAIAGFVYSKFSQSDVIYAKFEKGDPIMHSENYFNTHLGAQTQTLGADDVDKLVINAGAHDVLVRYLPQSGNSENNSFSFVVTSQYAGIYKQEKYPNGVDFNIAYDESTKTLTLNYETPNGLDFNRSGEIIVELPQQFKALAENIRDNNYQTSNPENLSTATLKIVSDKGNVSLGGTNLPGRDVGPSSIPNLDISTDSGDITLNTQFYACGNSLKLKSNKGAITCKNKINQQNMMVDIESGRGDVRFDSELIVSSMTINSSKADVKLKTLKICGENERVFWTGDCGRLFADKIDGSLIGDEDASATNFSIKHITGQFYLPKGDTCDVELGQVDGKVKIVSTNSNISIKNASSNVEIIAKKGSINLEKCSDIDVSSTNADVTLKECSNKIKVKTTKGKISGSITQLTGSENSLVTESSINIQFEPNMQFDLHAKSSKGKVRINYSYVNDENESEVNLKFNNNSSTSKIDMSAKNDIIISSINKKGE